MYPAQRLKCIPQQTRKNRLNSLAWCSRPFITESTYHSSTASQDCLRVPALHPQSLAHTFSLHHGPWFPFTQRLPVIQMRWRGQAADIVVISQTCSNLCSVLIVWFQVKHLSSANEIAYVSWEAWDRPSVISSSFSFTSFCSSWTTFMSLHCSHWFFPLLLKL